MEPARLLTNVSAFGFLGGKEAKAAGVGNLGLHDRKYLIWRGRLRANIPLPSQSDKP